MSDAPLFRAHKRRKTAASKPTIHQASPNKSDSESDENQHSNSIIRPSRAQFKSKSRSTGISFSNAQTSEVAGDGGRQENGSLVRLGSGDGEAGESRISGLSNRFVTSGDGGGGGAAAWRMKDGMMDEDRNLTAFIDAEMAKRHQAQLQAQKHSQTFTTRAQPSTDIQKQRQAAERLQDDIHADDASDNESVNDSIPGNEEPPTQATSQDFMKPSESMKTTPAASTTAQRQHPHSTNSHHQLTEIDLSSHSLQQQQAPKTNMPRKKKPKVRLGRDGKPMRPRVRKTRDEEDVAREALVEQVLQDNAGVAMYSTPAAAGGAVSARVGLGEGGRGDDEDADERMEREFLREFMERQTHGGRQQSAAGGGKSGGAGDAKKDAGVGGAASVLASGPRLGGSRSARARMVAALEKERDSANAGGGAGKGK